MVDSACLPVRVIADDLTGAADAGVTLRATGRSVMLTLGAHPGRWDDPARAVVAADTGTRDGTAASAAAAVSDLARRAPAASLVLKKIDSALRGHVAVEVGALIDVWPDRVVILAPAFPRNGRVTRGGIQHIGGIPLHEGEHWAVEDRQPPESLSHLLAEQATTTVGLDVVRSAAGLRVALHAAPVSSIVVCDAETDEDLDRIVAAGLAAGSVTWVGAAGLASALGRVLGAGHVTAPDRLSVERPSVHRPSLHRPPVHRPSVHRVSVSAVGPYLAVIGSAAAAAKRQARALAAEGGAHLVELDGAALADANRSARAEMAMSLAAVSARGNTVVVVGGAVDPVRSAGIMAALTEVAIPAAGAAGALVLAGGTTARAMLDALGVTTLDLVAELDPGIVLARPVDWRPVPVITKSGGFGDDRTLLRAVRRIFFEEGSSTHA